jgi:surface protein
MYATLAEIKATVGREGEICTCLENDTTYKYVESGSIYTTDDETYLITGNGGDTRWVAIGGKYSMYNNTEAINIVTGETLGFCMTIDLTLSDLFLFGFRHWNGYGEEAIIDWGDGSYSAVARWEDKGQMHRYASKTKYTIKYYGVNLLMDTFYSTWKPAITSILNWGSSAKGFISGAIFKDCVNLTTINSYSVPILGPLTYALVSNFEGCTSLTYIDVSEWDVSGQVDMGKAFYGCPAALASMLDISKWDVRSMTTMANFVTSPLSTAIYTAALIYWATLPVQSGAVVGFSTSRYTSDATAARAYLTGTKGWTITDGGII